MIHKKAQGMPINIIIIAAISLIVLVIIVMIFTGRIGIFAGESASCTANGGTCETGDAACTGELVKESPTYKCSYAASNTEAPDKQKSTDTNPAAKCCIRVG